MTDTHTLIAEHGNPGIVKGIARTPTAPGRNLRYWLNRFDWTMRLDRDEETA